MSLMILNDVFLFFIDPRVQVKTAFDFYSDLAALQSKGVAKHASIHLVKSFYVSMPTYAMLPTQPFFSFSFPS